MDLDELIAFYKDTITRFEMRIKDCTDKRQTTAASAAQIAKMHYEHMLDLIEFGEQHGMEKAATIIDDMRKEYGKRMPRAKGYDMALYEAADAIRDKISTIKT